MESSLRIDESPGSDEVVGPTKTTTPEEMTAQVDKLLASPPFQHSDSNRQLLLFLAHKAKSHPGQAIKEIELATSVFGLSLDTFDPQIDSAVRVKVGRLRAKILDYYAHYGMDDEIIIEIPKGAYCLVSQRRQGIEPLAPPVPDAPTMGKPELARASERSAPDLQQRLKSQWVQWASLLMLGIALGAFGSFFYSLRTKTEAPGQTKQLQVDHFWRSFTNSGHSALAVFSNPRLAGRVAHGGLHYFQDDNGTKSAEPLNITYSGAGDPTSIHLLTQLFDQYRWDLNVQPGALLSWEIAENANLIFIGRPEQNPALRELPRLQEFYFKFDEGIVNAHPQPGEESIYGYSIDNYDHAVIAYIPGIHPQQNTLVLAGNSTWGSQAAVECMTKEACVAAIMDKLQIKPGQKIPYFEALLNVKINDQVPVWNTIIAVRHYPTANLSWQTPLPNER